MNARIILTLAGVILLVGILGCERTEDAMPTQATIALTDFQYPGAIPASYGRLVGVTSSDTYPGWAQLWFERPDSSIVAVTVNFQNGAVRGRVLEIPRS